MRVERPFAHCCAEAGGHVASCDCVNKDHGTAFFDVASKPNTGADHARNYRQRQRAKLARMERGMASLAIAYVESVEAANKNFADGAITYGELKAAVNTAAFMRDAGLEPDKGL